jgi:hypothetical protein
LAVVLLAPAGVSAQVTIGSNNAPDKFSLLDLDASIVSRGLHLPRLTTAQRDALITDASVAADKILGEGLVIYNLDINCFEFWNGSKWKSFCESFAWFYMPSIVIDVTTSGTFERNLYLEYKKQFADADDAVTQPDSPTAGTALVKSEAGAPIPVTSIYDASELYYYVTGYDATVFSNFSITPAGVLTYTVNADNVTDATYMNIVFAVK